MSSALRVSIGRALAREPGRSNIRRAMDGLVAKCLRAFPDGEELERLRDQGRAIRAHAVARLPDLLEELEANCTRNGIQVHWAETGEEANGVVLQILRRSGARALLKGKSMVSEEMGLNERLRGCEKSTARPDRGVACAFAPRLST